MTHERVFLIGDRVVHRQTGWTGTLRGASVSTTPGEYTWEVLSDREPGAIYHWWESNLDLIPNDICDFVPDADLVNPKETQAARDEKLPLDFLEPAANRDIALALHNGAVTKGYGRRNFRQSPIKLSTYIGAIRRHCDALMDGEWDAPDSDISHLGHIGACVHVLLSAAEAGTYENDMQ